MNNTKIKQQEKEIIVACPCGKKLFKIKNPKEGFSFTCSCGNDLTLTKVNNEIWELVPSNNLWFVQ